MEKTALKQNSRDGSGETARVADRQEAVVGVPVIVPPVEVELALRVVLVEIRHIAIAIDLANGACAKSRPRHCPPIASQGLYRIRDLIQQDDLLVELH